MECCTISNASFLDNHVLCSPPRKLNLINVHILQPNIDGWSSRIGSQRFTYAKNASYRKFSVRHMSWRAFCIPLSLEEKSSPLQLEDNFRDDESSREAPTEELIEQPLNSDILKALLADSERAKILKKLSEANQHNRFLKREIQAKEDAFDNIKSKLTAMEFNVQALVKLAEEITTYSIPKGSRKIKGKYIQTHVYSRLKALLENLNSQMKDVGAVQAKKVSIIWSGMAESVQVMGTFDGWSEGAYLSQEYTGSYNKFSTTLLLRPGRYEIKLLVDGEWKLSPEFPTIGEGLMKNNLLIVE